MAYDISHLFDAEPPQADRPAPRVVRAVPAAEVVPAPSSVPAAQAALARELMQSAAIHDALVQQYLRMRGETFLEASAG